MSIRKAMIVTRVRLDSNGCIVFVLPKSMSEQVNKDGIFQVEFEEVESVDTKNNKVIVVKSAIH